MCLLPTLLCMPQNWLCCHLEQPSTTAEAFVLAAGCCDTFMESGMLHTAVHATKTSALIAVWNSPLKLGSSLHAGCRLFHDDLRESGLLPVTARAIKNFSGRTQPATHAQDLVQTVHVILRMLERLNASGGESGQLARSLLQSSCWADKRGHSCSCAGWASQQP